MRAASPALYAAIVLVGVALALNFLRAGLLADHLPVDSYLTLAANMSLSAGVAALAYLAHANGGRG